MYRSTNDLPFKEIFTVDFEFYGEEGEIKTPVCMAVRDLKSGAVCRYWQDELLNMEEPPFDTGVKSLFVAYYASAEISMFKVLGWKPPANILDLFTEFVCNTNGQEPKFGRGLVGALKYINLSSIGAEEKDQMRRLILSRGPWSQKQKIDILDYCQTDVDVLVPLLEAMVARWINSPNELGRAQLRGRYMTAVAAMEYNGVPIDVPLLTLLQANWSKIQLKLVEEVDRSYGVYEGKTFKVKKFEAYLAKNSIAWPRLESGKLNLKRETFSDRSKTEPRIAPLHALRKTLSVLNLNNLAVGPDERNRCMISAFKAKTGRNQPSNSQFIFGPAKWFRGLIKPVEGNSIAYLDWSSQEIAVAAALSGDEKMWNDYATGDPYISFAIQAGLAPIGANKLTHPYERSLCKQIVLGTQYGMSARGMADRTGIHIIEAQELLQKHGETYRAFWTWAKQNVNTGLAGFPLSTKFGWRMCVGAGSKPKPNTFLNWPMQAHGAEMLRFACCLATEAGLKVCAPIHDALLLEAPTSEITEQIARLSGHMREASEFILGTGKFCGVEAEVFHYPDRYMDENGKDMWGRIMRLLEEVQP